MLCNLKVDIFAFLQNIHRWSQGPCAEGEWLVLNPARRRGDSPDSDDFLAYLGVGVSVSCVTRPCVSGSFWWPELCECVGPEPGPSPYTVHDVCGDHETMVVTPVGQGVCTCQPGYSYDEVRMRSHRLHSSSSILNLLVSRTRCVSRMWRMSVSVYLRPSQQTR